MRMRTSNDFWKTSDPACTATMEELQSWWEVPSIAHFCSLFRAAFDLTDFDIEDLEAAILQDCVEEESSGFLVDLVCRLLMGCYGRDDICSFNYDLYVRDVIKYKWAEQADHPIHKKSCYKELNMREKVEVLHAICDYRLDAEDVMDLLKGLDGDNMRVEPLGKDSVGAKYWYFYGSRLYKEDPEPKKEEEKKEKKKKVKEKKKEKAVKKKQKVVKKEKKKGRKKRKVAEKQKKVEAEKTVEPEGSNIRRSGRIKLRQELELIVSEAAEEESSSEEEEEQEEESEESEPESSSEEEDEVPLVKVAKAKKSTKKPVARRGRGRRKLTARQKSKKEAEEAVSKDNDETADCEEKSDTNTASADTRPSTPDTKSESADTKSESADTISESVDNKSENVDKKSDNIDNTSDAGGKTTDVKPEGDVAMETNDSSVRKATDGDTPMKLDCGSQDSVNKAVKPETGEVKVEEKGNSADQPKAAVPATRWHLICSNLDDWVNLVEWFNDTKHKCEKDLCKVIREDFLPVLPEIIESREAEKRRRQQELEVRRSTRITVKQREKEEQDRILAEAYEEEEKARLEAEEERRIALENERLEREKRKREERIRAREERANRLAMREERARLVAEGKEIPPELLYTATPVNKYRDEYDSEDSRPELLDEDSFDSLMKVIEAIKNHHMAWPFLQPVSEDVAPGYHDIIKRPMDLSKIERKVELREYRTQQQFLNDFRLMFNNCRKFNGQESEFTIKARSLEKALGKLVKKFLTEEPIDSYYNDEDFMGRAGTLSEKKFRPKRAASSRALQTVHKALNSSDEEDSDEDDYLQPLVVPVQRKPERASTNTSLLLHEMIELKRQRQQRDGLEKEGYVVRPRPNPNSTPSTQGVMIMPREEVPTKGVLRLAATREIKWKIDPEKVQFNGRAGPSPKGKSQLRLVSGTPKGQKPAAGQEANSHLQSWGQATPPPGGNRIIKVMTSNNTSGGPQGHKAATADAVKISEDGYLIINGKNSGIKVSPKTKIVIQPPSGKPGDPVPVAKPLTEQNLPLVTKIPVPTSLPRSSSPRGSDSVATVQSSNKKPAILTARSVSGMVVKRPEGLMNSSEIGSRLVPGSSPAIKVAGFGDQPGGKRKAGDQLPFVTKICRPGTQPKSPSKFAPLQLGRKTAADQEPGPQEPEADTVSNVVQSVNITRDILDSYYSVLNNSSSTPSNGVETDENSVVLAGEEEVVDSGEVSTNVGASDSRTCVTAMETSNTGSADTDSSAQASTSPTGHSDAAHQAGQWNTEGAGAGSVLNSGASGGSEQSVLTNNGVTTDSAPSAMQHNGSAVTSIVPQSTPQPLEPQTSQNLNHSNSNSDMGPIEALFTGTSVVATVSPSKLNSVGSNLSPTNTQPQEVSPGKNSARPSLFDVFSSDNKEVVYRLASDNFGFAGLEESQTGLTQKSPDNGKVTVTTGSPLKTASVMEALKTKLMQTSPVKQAPAPQQIAVTPPTTGETTVHTVQSESPSCNSTASMPSFNVTVAPLTPELPFPTYRPILPRIAPLSPCPLSPELETPPKFKDSARAYPERHSYPLGSLEQSCIRMPISLLPKLPDAGRHSVPCGLARRSRRCSVPFLTKSRRPGPRRSGMLSRQTSGRCEISRETILHAPVGGGVTTWAIVEDSPQPYCVSPTYSKNTSLEDNVDESVEEDPQSSRASITDGTTMPFQVVNPNTTYEQSIRARCRKPQGRQRGTRTRASRARGDRKKRTVFKDFSDTKYYRLTGLNRGQNTVGSSASDETSLTYSLLSSDLSRVKEIRCVSMSTNSSQTPVGETEAEPLSRILTPELLDLDNPLSSCGSFQSNAFDLEDGEDGCSGTRLFDGGLEEDKPFSGDGRTVASPLVFSRTNPSLVASSTPHCNRTLTQETDSDSDLHRIEDDIFDLQDEYLGNFPLPVIDSEAQFTLPASFSPGYASCTAVQPEVANSGIPLPVSVEPCIPRPVSEIPVLNQSMMSGAIVTVGERSETSLPADFLLTQTPVQSDDLNKDV